MTTSLSLADIIKISPMLCLFLFSIIPITIKVLRGNKEPNPMVAVTFGMMGLIFAASLLFLVSSSISGTESGTAFSRALIIDGLAAWVGGLALFSGAAALILMAEHPATYGEQLSEMIFLTLSSVLGMLILVSALDLLVVFIGLELMSLALYMMIGMSHEQRFSKEASFKYFVLGSFASAILLYGIAFLFGTTSSTSISDIIVKTPSLIETSRLFTLGLVFVILGFCFKVSIAPFQAWTPDVYEGAPTPHTALMSTAVKAVCFAAFLRVLATKGLMGSDNLLVVMQWLAVLTMVVGNAAALIQTRLKRMLAYSSIAHSGYILVGMITAGSSDDMTAGASSVVFYLVGYTLMTIGAFAIVSLFERNEKTVVTMESLAGYAQKKPVMAFALTMFLLSLAGIPPTIGFFGKLYLFTAAVNQGFLWLALWGVLNSALAAYYYLRPIVMMYMHESNGDQFSASPMLGTRMIALLFAVLVLVFGVFSGNLYEIVQFVLG